MSGLSSESYQLRRLLTYASVLLGAVFWGLSGTAAQWLFQVDGFTPAWLVTVRMGVSGVLLVASAVQKGGREAAFGIWRDKNGDPIRLIVFAVIGLLGVQYTYFTSIQLGNAAAATFLQYVAPAMIAIFLAAKARKLPSWLEASAVLAALLGTLLLVTNGSLGRVVVPTGAVVWGLLSAVALAIYTLYPANLLRTWGPAVVVGWGMIIGAALMALICQPWRTTGMHWSVDAIGLIAFVTIFGTLIAFYLYLSSLRRITPTETSLLASAEPLAAAAAATLWLHVRLGLATAIGGLLIVTAVVLLALMPAPKRRQDALPEGAATTVQG